MILDKAIHAIESIGDCKISSTQWFLARLRPSEEDNAPAKRSGNP